MVKQMFLHTCSSRAMLSRVTFVIVLSRPELVKIMPKILNVTFITSQKVDQTTYTLQSNL